MNYYGVEISVRLCQDKEGYDLNGHVENDILGGKKGWII